MAYFMFLDAVSCHDYLLLLKNCSQKYGKIENSMQRGLTLLKTTLIPLMINWFIWLPKNNNPINDILKLTSEMHENIIHNTQDTTYRSPVIIGNYIYFHQKNESFIKH